VSSEKVKIKVSGYIEMSRENLDTILGYPDPHIGLVFCLHMGFVNSDNLDFEVIE
jgi:hypothetical protein